MIPERRTYRVVDGERIEGVWRQVLIHNGDYFLTELFIYADGAINCWGWTDLDGLRKQLASGWVATSVKEGARGSASRLVHWRFAEPRMFFTAEQLLGEVTDAIDRLNGRPDSAERCLLALDRFRQTGTEEDRRALRAAFLAVAPADRRALLGDMDVKDQPLRLLCTPVGESTEYGESVTEAHHVRALAYFAERDRQQTRWRQNRPADGPGEPRDPSVTLDTIVLRPSAIPGVECLRIEYPAPFEVRGDVYPTAVHAYWALATDDPAARELIRAAPHFADAERAAAKAPIRTDWPSLRQAVMHTVLRAKFDQHPDLADVLTGTGDGRLVYVGERPWIGRLLELVRSELAAKRAGF